MLSVWNSTGFAAAEGPLPQIPNGLRDVAEAAMPFYNRLRSVAL